jgi:hypothetical protein
MEIERQPILKQFFYLTFHIIRFLPKEYRKEISDGKSYRVTAPVRTTVPQLLT